MKIDRLIADVLLIAGESAEDDENGYERFGLPGVKEFLVSVAADCVARAIMETPAESLTGWKRLGNEGIESIAGGGCLLRLPERAMIVRGVKLSGWRRAAGEPLSGTHSLRGWQERPWEGLRATRDRPLAFHVISDGSPGLELFPGDSGSTLESGWYLERPYVSEAGEIDVPSASYHKAVDHMVIILRQHATMR